MRLSPSRAAAAALIGSSLLVGCASKAPRPASPVATPLSDQQAISIAEDYLDEQGVDEPRFVNYVEGTGDGNIVSVRSGFDAGAKPPVANHLVLVKHTGSVRAIRFREGD
jgi:hypothetical protein